MVHAMANWFPWMKLPTLSLDPPSIVLLGGATAGFAIARLVLGLGEAGNFPAAIKTVAEWFPKKERALATGIFNSGTNVGADGFRLASSSWAGRPTHLGKQLCCYLCQRRIGLLGRIDHCPSTSSKT